MLVLPRHVNQKPSGGMPIMRGHPLAHGLQFHARCDTPGYVNDLVNGLPLAWKAGTSQVHNREGVGLQTDASTEGANVVTPAYLKLAQATLVWRGVVFGTSDSDSALFNVDYGNNLTPFLAYSVTHFTGSRVRFYCNGGGTFVNIGDFDVIEFNKLITFAITVRDGSQVAYKNGLVLGSTTQAGAPTYSATSKVGIGSYASTDRNPNCWTDAVWIYGRVLTPTELVWLHQEPWSMYQHRSSFGSTVSAVVAANLRMLMGMGT